MQNDFVLVFAVFFSYENNPYLSGHTPSGNGINLVLNCYTGNLDFNNQEYQFCFAIFHQVISFLQLTTNLKSG